jgi:hypothetical protein
MYAFSPFIGRFTASQGTVTSVLAGSATLVAATVTAALSGEAANILFPSLWLLGIGWNFGLIGGSTMLLESVDDENRVAVQGSADLMMSFFGGMAGLSSGFIRRAVGFHMLSAFAMIAAGCLMVAAWFFLQRRRAELRVAS